MTTQFHGIVWSTRKARLVSGRNPDSQNFSVYCWKVKGSSSTRKVVFHYHDFVGGRKMRFAIQRLYAWHLTAQWSQRDDSDLPEFASVARTAHSGRLVRHDRGEK